LTKGVNIVDSAREDIIPFAERIMQLDANGQVTVKDGVGYEPGMNFGEVLADLQASGRRAHWFPGNTGAGAGGATGTPSTLGQDNPFKEDSFNFTEIGQIVKSDPAKAKLLAKAAGRTDLIKSFGL